MANRVRDSRVVVEPEAQVALGHRAYHVRTTASGHVMTASKAGLVSVFGPDAALVARFEAGGELESANVAPSGEAVALTFAEGVRIASVAGGTLRDFPGSFLDAWFDDRGRVWAVRLAGDDDGAVVSVFARHTDPEPDAECELEDPFGDSAWMFPLGPTGLPVALWVAAGQDGQSIYWLDERKGRLIEDAFEECQECNPPSFNDDASEFLLFVDNDELHRYSYPECELLGKLALPGDGGGQCLGTDAFYVGRGRALMSTEDGFAYLVDTERMRVVEAVAVVGHEPGPMTKLYPTLDDDGTGCSDLTMVRPVGPGRVVSVHTELPDPQVRQHSVLAWWDVPGVPR